MSLKTLRGRNRRFVPAIVGTGALLGGFFLLQFGVMSKAPADGQTQLAAAAAGDGGAERDGDAAANRGSGRTGDQLSPEMIAALQNPATAPADELDPTTTTAAPTTTVAPTTVPPTTVLVTVPPTTKAPSTTAPKPPSTGNSQSGGASYYAQPWANKGCAHKTLPKGTVLTVTNVANGKTATCVVNDRGPYIAGRIIDLDTSIFRQLASTGAGVFQARINW